MRLRLAMLIASLVGPAAAQQWVEHSDEKRGVVVTLPLEFKRTMGGLAYVDPATDRGVIIWRGDITTTFDDAAREEISAAAKTRTVLDQAITSKWATYSAIREDGRRMDARLIPLCDGRSFAGFQAVYPTVDAQDMEPIVEQIASGFHAIGC